MPQPDVNFAALTQRLQGRDLPIIEPPADLWSRIAARHVREQQRARRRRIVAIGAVSAAVIAAVGVLAAVRRPTGSDDIDWQARAQALELRLHALDLRAAGGAADSAEAQLAQLDALLQAAYDNGAQRSEVLALWKRRSELLDTLVRLRQHNSEINRT